MSKQKMKEELFNACRDGNKSKVLKLIELGVDINAKNEDRWTALMFASSHYHKEICEILVSKGADVNAKANDGYTALLLTSEFGGNYEICKLLIDNGANVNAKDRRGFTALMGSYFNKPLRNLLIKKGVDINAKNIYDRTVFSQVIQTFEIIRKTGTVLRDCEETCEFLIDNGAEVSGEDLERMISLGWKDLCFKIIENRAWERRKHMIAMFKHVRKY